MDLISRMNRAFLSKHDHNHDVQLMGVLSLACDDHAIVDDGGTRPRHRLTRGIQPHGMDVVVYAARALNAATPKPYDMD